MDKRIPKEYRKFWTPCQTKKILFHLSTEANLGEIKKKGFLEPRDPSPKHWAGLSAVFLSDPADTLFFESMKHVKVHVAEKHEKLVRLHVKTQNKLYRSTDPKRTFQIISLDPIHLDEVLKSELL